jgi:DNA-directed RNA polymerase specialized sigma24 family protein
MDDAPALAAAADSSDPRTGLRAVAALRRLLEQLEALQVDNARDKGWSWQEIAEILGVSRQAVHKKHAGRMREAQNLPSGEAGLTRELGHNVFTESIYMTTRSHTQS